MSVRKLDSKKAEQEQAFETALEKCMSLSAARDFPMTFNVIHGFLFGLCSAPVAVTPMDWIPTLFGDNDDIMEAIVADQDSFQVLVDFYNYMMDQVQIENPELPQTLVISNAMSENFGMESELGQWSQGFIDASEWLADVWDSAMIDVLEEDYTVKSVMLGFFSDESFSRELHEELVEEDNLTFEDVYEDFLRVLPDTLKAYAFLGRKIYELQLDDESVDDRDVNSVRDHFVAEQPFTAEPKVGRNDPCSCGSGKKFKKCCLH